MATAKRKGKRKNPHGSTSTYNYKNEFEKLSNRAYKNSKYGMCKKAMQQVEVIEKKHKPKNKRDKHSFEFTKWIVNGRCGSKFKTTYY